MILTIISSFSPYGKTDENKLLARPWRRHCYHLCDLIFILLGVVLKGKHISTPIPNSNTNNDTPTAQAPTPSQLNNQCK